MFSRKDWEEMSKCEGNCDCCSRLKKICLFDIESFKEISLVAKSVLNLIVDNKLFEDMSQYEKIISFVKEFRLGIKYPVREFCEWHNKLTNTSKNEIENILWNKGISSYDLLTLNEFIDLTINENGGDIFKTIKERYIERKLQCPFIMGDELNNDLIT